MVYSVSNVFEIKFQESSLLMRTDPAATRMEGTMKRNNLALLERRLLSATNKTYKSK